MKKTKFHNNKVLLVNCCGMGKSALVVALVCLTTCAVSCRSARTIVKEVPVEIHDTTYETHTEYVYKTDTLINNIETIVREANAGDSILLSKLGVQLSDKERTILVLRNELERTKSESENGKIDTVIKYVERGIPLNDTEYIEVEKPLTWWQKTLMWLGVGFILVVVGSFVFMCLTLKERI